MDFHISFEGWRYNLLPVLYSFSVTFWVIGLGLGLVLALGLVLHDKTPK